MTFREWLSEGKLNPLDKLGDDVESEGEYQGFDWKVYNNFMVIEKNNKKWLILLWSRRKEQPLVDDLRRKSSIIFNKFVKDEFENFERNSLDVYVDSSSASGDYVIIPEKNKNFEAELKKYKIKISTKSKEGSSHEITNLKEFLNFIKNEFKVEVYDNKVYAKSGKLELFGNQQQGEFLINVYNGPDYDDDDQLIDHNIKRKIASKKQNTFTVKQFISEFLK